MLNNKKILQNTLIEYVNQVNGKKRGNLKPNKDITQDSLIEEIKKIKNLEKIFQNKKIEKVFFVKNRLINFLIS